jgi:hypothetical protein
MTKKKLYIILVALFVFGAVSFYMYHTKTEQDALVNNSEVKVLLAVNHKDTIGDKKNIVEAYESVLEEEGVSHKVIDIYQLMTMDPVKTIRNNPIIVFPDSIATMFYGNELDWLRTYVEKGGIAAVICDAGTKDKRGFFLEHAVLTPLLGFNYSTYDEVANKDNAFGTGYVKFTSKQNREFFEIPDGKTDEENYLIGYIYGKLEYPLRNIPLAHGAPADEQVIAQTVDKRGTVGPCIVVKNLGKGKIIYDNLPLGALKLDSDDLLLRSFLRTVMFKYAQLPHVLNIPQGLGGIVINWHLDSSIEHENFPRMIDKGLLHSNLPMSFHVTAGDFLDEEGDGEGFMATESPGRDIILQIMNYGQVGSHGGWAHNWFADQLEAGKLNRQQLSHYIKINNDAIEEVTKRPVTEYSAPNGVFPQPVNTEVIQKFGIRVYYYTGDSGSVMNRTFYQGKMVSDKVLAFPVMPNGKYASFYEMNKAGLSAEQVNEWLEGTANFAVKTHSFRLIYSHPYDIVHYEDTILGFLNWLDKNKTDGKISVRTMTDVADFYLRFLKTKYNFTKTEKGLKVKISNPEGLRDITFAIPKKNLSEPQGKNMKVRSEGDYYYVTIEGDINELETDMLSN